MTESPAGNQSSIDAEARSEPLQDLLFAVVASVILVPLSLEVASVRLTLAAVGSGLLLGGVIGHTLHGARLQVHSELVTALVALAAIVATTVVLWLVLPATYLPTFGQFALAFVWGVILPSLVSGVVGSSDPD